MPKTGHAPISIRERMDKYKLIMKNRGKDEGVDLFACPLHPRKKVFHKRGNAYGRRRHKNALVPCKNAFLSTAELAALSHSEICHDPVEAF